MINKKTKRLLSSILGAALITGIVQMPVLADDNVQTQSSYIANSSSTGISNSVEQNGVKITLSNVVGTKHRLRATVTIQSQTPFDESVGKTADILLTYGDNTFNGQGMSFRYPDDKTLVVTIERRIDKNVLPEKGSLRIDVVMQKNKVNVGFDTNVDFSESLKNSIEKDFSIAIPQFNSTLNKLQSDVLGTQLSFTEQDKKSLTEDHHIFNRHSFILKIGNKMYSLRPSGSYSADNTGSNMSIANYTSKSATYDKVKNETDMSLIPISFNINLNNKESLSNEKENDSNMETINNVSYTKSFAFSDGTKGEIYNIQRDDNSIKVSLKGANEKESLLMASTMSMDYKIDEAKKDNDYYDSTENTIFYKDPNNSSGYIVEFSNVKKDKNVQLRCEAATTAIDQYTIGDEISLSK